MELHKGLIIVPGMKELDRIYNTVPSMEPDKDLIIVPGMKKFDKIYSTIPYPVWNQRSFPKTSRVFSSSSQ